jgi:hypothetical protein
MVGDFLTYDLRNSTEVKNDWDNAINLVKMKINECDQNITNLNQSIADLTEQQKKMIMNAVLGFLGVFIAFTAAVFIPGVGLLAALGVAGIHLVKPSLSY